MGQFGRKLIHIYKKLFEDLKSSIDHKNEKIELPDDSDWKSEKYGQYGDRTRDIRVISTTL